MIQFLIAFAGVMTLGSSQGKVPWMALGLAIILFGLATAVINVVAWIKAPPLVSAAPSAPAAPTAS